MKGRKITYIFVTHPPKKNYASADTESHSTHQCPPLRYPSTEMLHLIYQHLGLHFGKVSRVLCSTQQAIICPPTTKKKNTKSAEAYLLISHIQWNGISQSEVSR